MVLKSVALVCSAGPDPAVLARALEAAGFEVLAFASEVPALTRCWPSVGDLIAIGDLEIDCGARRACIAGRTVDLTDAEFDLLQVLARRAGEIISREELSRALRGLAWDGRDRTIDLRVGRLRRKLGDDARRPSIIRSVRGEGYMLISPAR